jgi:multidrug resistance protein, MATE family
VSVPLGPAAPARPSVAGDLVRLGWPVLVAQLAIMLYGMLDTLMAGRYATEDLAAVGIGSGIYITVFVSLSGVLLALTPVAAQAFGAGRLTEIGEQVRQCLWLALLLSVLVVAALQMPEPFLRLTRAAPPVAEKIRQYLQGICYGVPALLFFRVFGSFSNAISRPRVVMGLNLLGLVLKLPLNWVFMYGHLGSAPLGAAGCALATSACAWATCLLGWWLCARGPAYRPYGVFRHASWPQWRPIRHLLALGLPIGATFMVDVTAFTFMTLFIARLGAATSAAHQIAANFAVLLYMLPLALGNAATVLVGQSIGARDPARARATGLHALLLGEAVAVVFASAVVLGREAIATLYTEDQAVRAAAAALLGLVAGYHLFDALQAVAVNVLRGYKRTVVPMLIYTLAQWGVGLGGGYLLALTPVVDLSWLGVHTPLGAAGFWAAAIGSLLCAGGLVSLDFLWVSRRSLAGAAPAA